MIIVKTKNGDHFINDKAVIKVEHNKERATVTCFADKGIYSYMENVEQVVYTSDAQQVEWKDEGSEIQRLKADLEKEQKKFSQLLEHFGYIRELYWTYGAALMAIKELANHAEMKGENIESPLYIIEEAENKCKDAEKRFESARKKWEE